jgi:type I restriction enzyme S subunit
MSNINTKPNDWQETTLGEIAEIKYGKDHKNLIDGKVPCYGSGGLMRNVEKALYDKPSVLIPRKGTISNLFFVEIPFWTVDTLFYTKINEEKVFPKFLFYKLKNENLEDLNVGSAVPSLTTEVLNDFSILIPPLPEQRAIAAVLSSLDDKIELLRQENETLEQIGQTIFKEWFNKYSVDKPEELPEGWRVGKLSEIATFLNGLALQKFPPESGIEYLPVIKIRELKSGITEQTEKASKYLDEKYIVDDGDIIFSWSGSLEVVIWKYGKGALNQHLFKVTSVSFPKWFYYFWVLYYLPVFRNIAYHKATTMGHIQRKHLDEALIFIPNNKELEKMNALFEPIIKKIILNNTNLNNLLKTRDTLLPKLMSGEIMVK